MGCRLTHLGGPTVLIELDGWRILTDPTFDQPGRRYAFGLGTSSTKTAAPAAAAEDLGPIDVILLSHDHHADNLDDRGRELLPAADTVITTTAGARRLAASNVSGLRAGGLLALDRPGRPPLTVRATPCRHGPPLSRPLTGQVIGFALSLDGAEQVAVWMTGDTVLHRPLRRLARRLDVDVMLVHLGSVQFPITGPLRYSMNSTDARQLIHLTDPRVAVPVHYEGWSHFHEPQMRARADLPELAWLRPGRPTDMRAPER
ncbi:MBL fold metallo-hydrolase [Nocardioides sp. CER19]|uniref:MBL fold metallo-hydrolase n=1 Tax=Nocardioides sp. CER19 TaxID=3038538 RepID=UPI0024493F30|nr:MBL fold metallo-hydrolase [Nocardioides sp. CER19]MDH2413901.1 MBL fold metallo-hydrolase [Nocardioides sp. CER19]